MIPMKTNLKPVIFCILLKILCFDVVFAQETLNLDTSIHSKLSDQQINILKQVVIKNETFKKDFRASFTQKQKEIFKNPRLNPAEKQKQFLASLTDKQVSVIKSNGAEIKNLKAMFHATVPPAWIDLIVRGTKPLETTDKRPRFYSTDPYNQHGRMTYNAMSQFIDNKGRYVLGYLDSGASDYLRVSETDYGFYKTYGGWAINGNVATDNTGDHIDYFVDLYGSRAESQNHHSLRDGEQSAFQACMNIKGDMRWAIQLATSEYNNKNYAYWVYTLGHVTHTIQDSFAPAHTTRSWTSPYQLEDICTIHTSVSGACRHPEGWSIEADDADDNPEWEARAVSATEDFLYDAIFDAAVHHSPSVGAFRSYGWIDKTFFCSPLAQSNEIETYPTNWPYEIKGYGGQCLDVMWGDFNRARLLNQPVWMWKCNNGPAQHWYLEDKRIVIDKDLCLTAGNGVGGAGATQLTVSSCYDGPYVDNKKSQEWFLMSNGEIRHQGGMCLDVAGAGTNDGTPVQLWPCYGGDNQKWRVYSQPPHPPPIPTN